jgi:hypothetical protein
MELTYQQILAQQYAENASAMLAAPPPPDEEDDVDVYDQRGGGYQLENPDEYRQFAGDRNQPDIISKPQVFEDKSKLSVRYNKDVLTRVYNVDTRFRAFQTPGTGYTPSAATATGDVPIAAQAYLLSTQNNNLSLATHFVFRTKEQIKNAISIKMSSLELPNKFYNVFRYRGNVTLFVRAHSTAGFNPDNPTDTTAPYAPFRAVELLLDTANPDPNQWGYYYNNISVVRALEKALNSAPIGQTDGGFGPGAFTCTRHPDGRMTIASSAPLYDFYFPYSIVSPQVYATLADALGFYNVFYGFNPDDPSNQAGVASITSEDPVDMNADTYIYLQINDYNTVTPQVRNDAYFNVFAKIPIVVDKGAMVSDTDVTNTTTKTYRFIQPTNIHQLEIRLLDQVGNTLQMDRVVNYSMTLEVEEVVSTALYEKLREM